MIHPKMQAVRAISTLAAAGVLAFGLAAGSPGRALASPRAAASHTPSFQSLGQMPGSALGTDVSGISGDGSTIAGYGSICTTFNPNGSCQSAGNVQAFRWTPAGGYQKLGTPGTSAFFGAGAVSSDGSVIVGEHPPENGYAAFRWTAAAGMVQLPINIASAVTPDGGMVAGGDSWWKTTGQTGAFGSFPGFQGQTETYGLGGPAQAPAAAGASIKGSNASGAADHAFLWTPATGLQDLGDAARRRPEHRGGHLRRQEGGRRRGHGRRVLARVPVDGRDRHGRPGHPRRLGERCGRGQRRRQRDRRHRLQRQARQGLALCRAALSA